MKKPSINPSPTAMIKPISSRLSDAPVASNNLPSIIPSINVLRIVTPPGSFGMISGGHIKAGKTSNLDIASQITIRIMTKIILLKVVIITKLLLQHLFHFLF